MACSGNTTSAFGISLHVPLLHYAVIERGVERKAAVVRSTTESVAALELMGQAFETSP